MASNTGTYELTVGTNPVVKGSVTITSVINSSGKVTFTCAWTLNALSSGYYWNYGITVQARQRKRTNSSTWGDWTSWGTQTLVAENTSTWSKKTGSFTRSVESCTDVTDARIQVRFNIVDETIGIWNSDTCKFADHTSDIVKLVVAKGDNITAVSKSPNQTYHIDGDSITANCTLATEEGYTTTFNKWTSNNTSSVANSTSQKYTFNVGNAESVTLTASATKTANTYTIVYNANGGTGSMSNTSVTWGVKVPLRTNTFVRDGYKFKGWNAYRASDKKWRYSNGTNTEEWYTEGSQPSGYSKYIYGDGDNVWKTSPVNKDTATFYAVWEFNGYIYIDNGSGWDKYQVYIDNGSSWDLYVPFVDNGSGWDKVGG